MEDSREQAARSQAVLASLRDSMQALYALRDVSLPELRVRGDSRPVVITMPADPNAPLDHFSAPVETAPWLLGAEGLPDAAAEQARAAIAAGIHMPYWGLLWASGQALARVVLEEPEWFQGRRVLDLGCGLGLVTAAALAARASVWAVDCFAEALLFTRFNGLRVAGREPEIRLLDWRTPAGAEACRALGPFATLVAADVLYEQEDLEPLLELLPSLLDPGGSLWLAEPGRRVSRQFLQAAMERRWVDRERVFDRDWPPDGEVVRVQVHHFQLPA